MSEEDLEVLITMDDPGEDTLEEDTFHLQADNSTARDPVNLNEVANQQTEVILDNDFFLGSGDKLECGAPGAFD